MVEPRHQEQGGAERHEQKIERRRILVASQEREHGHAGYLCPGVGISVDIDPTEDQKGESHAKPDTDYPPPATGRVHTHDGAEAVAKRHHRYPGYQRVDGRDGNPTHAKDADLMEDVPDPGRGDELAGRD